MPDSSIQQTITIVVEDKGTAQKQAKNLDSLSKSASRLNKTSDGTTKSIFSLGKSLISSSLFSRRMLRGVMALGQGMSNWFTEANDYVEALNLFNVAMGSATKGAEEFVQKAQDLAGLDSKEVMEYMGTFNMMLEGFGHGTEAAAQMSQQLTQLAYDISSLYNVDVSTAFNKLSSGMAGQVKGLRDYGISVTVASLKETALRHNIQLSVSAMTEAQKATLRYVTIMENSKNVQGDLARTILTPANSLRILNNQWTLCKRAMGQVVSVIAVKVIPWFMALIKIIRAVAESLAGLFGYKLPELDYSGLADASGYADDLDDSLDSANKSAKKLQRTLMGFDEINRLDAPDTGSGGSGGANGLPADLGLDLSEYSYDFFKGLSNQADEYVEKLKTILKVVGAIGGAFAIWKLGNGIIPSIDSITSKLNEIPPSWNIVNGAILTVAGSILYVISLTDAWKNGFDVSNLIGSLIGLASAGMGVYITYLGVTTVFGEFAGACVGLFGGIGIIIGGLALIVVGAREVINTGGSWKSWVAILGGTIAVVGAIGAVFGGIPALIAGVILSVGVLAFAIKTNAGGIRDKITEFIGDIWVRVQNFWIMLKNIPILGHFVSLIEGIVKAVVKLGKKIFEIAYTILQIPVQLMKAFGSFLSWIGNKILSGIKWINTHVVKPLLTIFTPIADGFIGMVTGGIKSAMNVVFYFIESKVNGFIKGINSITGILNKIPNVNIHQIQELSLPRFANGGLPPTGQMFVARENGAELVGNIGNRTAVMNNDQIVSAVAQGVAQAVASVMGGSQEVVVNVDGKALFDVMVGQNNSQVRRTGTSPLLV